MAKEFPVDDWQDFDEDPFLNPRLKSVGPAHIHHTNEMPKSQIKRVAVILCTVAAVLALHFMTESIATADARDEGFRSGFHASQIERPANGSCLPGS